MLIILAKLCYFLWLGMHHTFATTYLFAYFIVLKAIALGNDIPGSNNRDIVDKIVSSLLCSAVCFYYWNCRFYTQS